MDIPGAQVGTGSTYYGSMSYNAQMTYDFGTDRLYLHATYHTKQLAMSSGMYMFMLGEGTPELVNLGKISVQTAPGRTTSRAMPISASCAPSPPQSRRLSARSTASC